MWSRRILVLFIGLLAGLFDATVSSWFAGGGTAIRVALPLVILLGAFSSRERAVTAAIAAGLVLDALLPSFGLVTIRLVLVALAIHAVSQGYVTNRSVLGSLALGLIGLATDRLLLLLITFLRRLGSTPFVPEVQPPVIAQILWTLMVLIAAFVLFAAFTKRFMPLVTRR